MAFLEEFKNENVISNYGVYTCNTTLYNIGIVAGLGLDWCVSKSRKGKSLVIKCLSLVIKRIITLIYSTHNRDALS